MYACFLYMTSMHEDITCRKKVKWPNLLTHITQHVFLHKSMRRRATASHLISLSPIRPPARPPKRTADISVHRPLSSLLYADEGLHYSITAFLLFVPTPPFRRSHCQVVLRRHESKTMWH